MDLRDFRVLFSVILFWVVSGNIAVEAATAQQSRPNILFCIADDASFPHMGAYGCSWVKTPGFDRVAREGVLFTNAYTPNAKCAPSRACILTGRNSWQLKQAGNHMAFFPPEFKTYVEALADAGYVVGRTAKGWAPGVAVDAAGKRRNPAGPAYNRLKAKPPAKGISAIDYAANFEQFLKDCPHERSWCFWYGGLEPHRRYEYGSGISKAGKKLTDIDRVPAYWPDTEVIRNDMLDYAYEIEHFDRHLVRMLEALEQQNQLDNTIVVVTADNGMPFPRVKGQEYERSNHLPLAVMWKKGIKAKNRKVDDYVSFIDFAPTFIEAAGLQWEQTGMQPTAGRSLSDIFHSNQSGIINAKRDHVLIGKERHDIGRPFDQGYPIRGIVKGGMLYLKNDEPRRWPAGNPETGYLNCDGSPTKTAILNLRRAGQQEQFWALAFGRRKAEELYSIQDDPECLQNLAAFPKFQSVKNALKKQLKEELIVQKDPRALGKGAIFEGYQYSDARTRDFYQRFMKGEKIKAGWVNETDFESKPID